MESKTRPEILVFDHLPGFSRVSELEYAFWLRIAALTEQFRGVPIHSDTYNERDYTEWDRKFIASLRMLDGYGAWGFEVVGRHHHEQVGDWREVRIELSSRGPHNVAALIVALQEFQLRFDIPPISFSCPKDRNRTSHDDVVVATLTPQFAEITTLAMIRRQYAKHALEI